MQQSSSTVTYRACKYRWFDSWDRLVNAALRAVGAPVIRLQPGEVAIDPHIHTLFSRCSISTPERIIMRAAALGIKGIGILDHNDPRGIGEAERRADDLKARGLAPEDFLIIPGVEVSAAGGHIGALFVREPIAGNRSPAETVDAIHEAGGLAVAVHPYHSTGIGDVLFDVPIDAVETQSGYVFSSERAARAAELMHDPRLASVAKLGSSDAHYVDGIASCYTVLKIESLTLEAARAAIVAGVTEPRQSEQYLRLRRWLRRIRKLH